MAVYYNRAFGASGHEIVRHVNMGDGRSRRRARTRREPRSAGAHRLAAGTRQWMEARVSVWRGLALLSTGACIMLAPLVAVVTTVGLPGSGGSQIWSLHPNVSGTTTPGRHAAPALRAPGEVPPEYPGATVGGSPSKGPAEPQNPRVRPGLSSAPSAPLPTPDDVSNVGVPWPGDSAAPPPSESCKSKTLFPGAVPSLPSAAGHGKGHKP